MYDTYNDPNRMVLNMDGSPVDGMATWDGGPVYNPDPLPVFEPTGYKYPDGNTNDTDPPILPVAQEPLPPVPAPVPDQEPPTSNKKLLIIAAIAIGAYFLLRKR